VSAEAKARERRVRGRRRVREERATTKNAREEDETNEITARELARTRREGRRARGRRDAEEGGTRRDAPLSFEEIFSRIAERADDPDAIATGDSIRRDLNCEARCARTTPRLLMARATRRASRLIVVSSRLIDESL
jgi:hypothetical protein